MIDVSKVRFCDTETTGLDPSVHRVWEVAVGSYDAGGELVVEVAQLRLPDEVIGLADPVALEVNGFHGRYDPEGALGRDGFARWVAARLEGAVLVGKNPGFDDGMLRATLGYVGPAPWHYRMLCVDQMAFGALVAAGVEPGLPWRSNELAELLGVDVPDGRHTAEGDVRLVEAMWRAVAGLVPAPPARFVTTAGGDDRWDYQAWVSSDIVGTSGGQGYVDRGDAVRQAVARAHPGDVLDGEVLTFAWLAELRRRYFGG